jgi:hypothetical protein
MRTCDLCITKSGSKLINLLINFAYHYTSSVEQPLRGEIYYHVRAAEKLASKYDDGKLLKSERYYPLTAISGLSQNIHGSLLI